MIMKKLTLIWLCLTLTTAFALATDYRLVQTYIADSNVAGKSAPVVHVLLPSDNSSRPVVFQTFGSKAMESSLSALPKGSVVTYDANGFAESVPSAQLDAIRALCQTNGITFRRALVL